MSWSSHFSLPTLNGCYFLFTFLNPFWLHLNMKYKFCFLWNSQLSQKACPGYNLQSWYKVSQSGLFRNINSFFLPFFSHFNPQFFSLVPVTPPQNHFHYPPSNVHKLYISASLHWTEVTLKLLVVLKHWVHSTLKWTGRQWNIHF